MRDLCRQTVTVYRFGIGGDRSRRVIEGCHCAWEDGAAATIIGEQPVRKFRLFLPGAEEKLAPGDWICEGVGPENAVFPSQIPGAAQVIWVKPQVGFGFLAHTEAGN